MKVGVPTLAMMLAAILLAFIGSLQIFHAREVDLADARTEARNLTRALAQHAARTVGGIDLVLSGIVERLEGSSDRSALNAELARRQTVLRQTRNLVVTDADGNWTHEGQPHDTPTNSRDRPYFGWHRDHPDRGMHIDAVVSSKYGSRPLLPVTRRYESPDGSFAGIVIGALDLDHIAAFYKTLDVGDGGTIGLWSQDGRNVLRQPAFENLNSAYRNVILAEASRLTDSGSFVAKSPIDGVMRITAFERVDRYPQLLVTAALSVDTLLAAWRHDALVQGSILGVAVVALIGIGLFLESRTRQAKRAADAMSESEARYRLIADHASDVIMVKEAAWDGARTYVSPACLSVLGYEPKAFKAIATRDVIHRDDLDGVRTAFESVSAENPRVTIVIRFLHGDGRWIWVETVHTWMPPLAGESPKILFTTRDVSERIASETAILRSQARYRLLADNTRDMIAEVGLDYRRVFVSPASWEILGYRPDELIGTRPQDFAHPDDLPAFAAMIKTLASGSSEHGVSTHRLRHRDGRWVWVEGVWSLIRDADGEPVGFVASVRNVEARRLAEEAVRASEARFRLLAENTSELIMLGHDDGRRSYISPASHRLLGYAPEELAALGLRDYVHPDDVAALFAATRRLDSGAMETSVVYRARHRLGHHVWVEGRFRRIAGARGGEPTIVATFSDVSERREQATALEDAKNAAEQARAAAEQASVAKTDFLSAMSHEIRTPLNSVLGYADLILEDGGLDETQRSRLMRIQSAGAALRTVVDDILDFSKIEAGLIDLDPRPFKLRTLVDDAMSIVLGCVGRKRLDLRASVQDDVPDALIGDEDRLRQILLNLLNNAVKFTPAGSIALSATLLKHDENGASVRFEVADTGIGIPDDKKPLLFQRFSQVDGSISRVFGGTGLGLAISKSLVDAMGGTIGFDSVAGTGSVFWFTVRLPSEGHGQLDGFVAMFSQRPPRSAFILLAEDVEINQDLARAVLEGGGHTVDVVGDGAAAVDAVFATTYDLVLMDVQMPVMDGITATRRIRESNHPSRDIPIVAMTANVMPDQVTKLSRAGMNAHVGKPFKRSELLDAVRLCMASGDRSDPIA